MEVALNLRYGTISAHDLDAAVQSQDRDGRLLGLQHFVYPVQTLSRIAMLSMWSRPVGDRCRNRAQKAKWRDEFV
jgi:hypothetical protein